MTAPAISLVELEACPTCAAKPGHHCQGYRREGRIWPWHTGSAGPEWCHRSRYQLAAEQGRVEELTAP